MSWRLLAAAGTLSIFLGIPVVGSSSRGHYQRQEPARLEDGGAGRKACGDGRDAAAAAHSQDEDAAAKAKTSAAKTKTKKGAARSNSKSSASSGSSEGKYELATFGAGCFWHVEADFERLNGVISAVSGYAGGNVRNPNYEMVHEGFTGHAEVVMVQYDPEIISYEDLLKVFWQSTIPPRRIGRGPTWERSIARSSSIITRRRRKAALELVSTSSSRRAFPKPDRH